MIKPTRVDCGMFLWYFDMLVLVIVPGVFV